MTGTLADKIALVTGGGAGIGFGIAKRFAEERAHVFIVGRRQSQLDQALAAIGGDTAAIQGDVSNLADLDRVYATVEARAGRIDVLAVNAGVYEFATLGRSPRSSSIGRLTRTYAVCCSPCRRRCHC
jgi:NAD(P)-dependent dehydrogenase (short-subunit alcohol dehydrogenase family)